MKLFLTVLCCLVLAAMLYVTVSTSLHQDVISATLADAYFGFLFFWLWVVWREQSVAKSILWFVLIMTLGVFSMSPSFITASASSIVTTTDRGTV